METVDAVGAGDAFAAGLVAALLDGTMEADRLLSMANAAGALAATARGGMAALPTREAMAAIMEDA